VPVEAGMNRVEIRFARTWDRAMGAWISLVTMLGVVGFVFLRKRRTISQSESV
jgi:hypothetical protein